MAIAWASSLHGCHRAYSEKNSEQHLRMLENGWEEIGELYVEGKLCVKLQKQGVYSIGQNGKDCDPHRRIKPVVGS